MSSSKGKSTQLSLSTELKLWAVLSFIFHGFPHALQSSSSLASQREKRVRSLWAFLAHLVRKLHFLQSRSRKHHENRVKKQKNFKMWSPMLVLWFTTLKSVDCLGKYKHSNTNQDIPGGSGGFQLAENAVYESSSGSFKIKWWSLNLAIFNQLD